MMNRSRFYPALVVLLVFAGLIWWSAQNIWRSPAYYSEDVSRVELSGHILSLTEYAELIDIHSRPYVVEIEGPSGAVLLYGAEHTRDPRHPQIADIQKRWEEFNPTVALVEGRLDFFVEGFMDPVEELGEGGWVNQLARHGGVPSFTWELAREQEVALMLERYPRERVALFYFLRPYAGSLRFGKPEDPDVVVEQTIEERKRIPGLEGTFDSAEDIDLVWQRDFAGLPDWRDTSDEFGWPGYLGEIAEGANTIRDEHLARLIIYLVRKGERVFAIAGSAHAVELDSALRDSLSPE